MIKDNGLNEKQKKFCREYIKDFNATQSAIRAGYSQKTARPIGSRLLTYVAVQKYIKMLTDETKRQDIMSVQERLAFLTQVARGEIKDEVIIPRRDGVERVDKRANTSDRVRAVVELDKMEKLSSFVEDNKTALDKLIDSINGVEDE